MKPHGQPAQDIDQTRAFLSHLLDSDAGCIEMRVFKAAFNNSRFVEQAERFSKTLAGWYDDPHPMIVDVTRLKDVSAYVTFNPVSSDLLARSYNELRNAKHTTTDADVRVIRWLYVDIDPVRPADISSTDDELAWAIAKRDDILADDVEIRRSALWGCSGNGAWILVRLPDYAASEEHRSVIGDALADLARRYSDGRIKVDVSTKNPSRVMCLPGTRKCKGSNIASRPHRLVTFDGPTTALRMASNDNRSGGSLNVAS